MTAFLPIVRSATLHGYEQLARELRLDASALLRQAGLHPRSLRDPETPLAAEAVHRLLATSARASGLSDFGLRLAARRSFDSLGPISLLIKGQPTLGDALQTLLRYLRLVNPSLLISVLPRGKWVVLQEELAGVEPAATSQAIELALGVMHGILVELLGPHWRPVAVHFQHAAPERTAAHEAFFACPVHFRDGFNGIALRPADLETRPQGGDPGLARLAGQALDGALQTEQGPAAVVRQLVMALLPGGGCTAPLVARQLGVDRRTLHRYLSTQGQTFSSLLQDLRAEWVHNHLHQGHIPLSEVAVLLGFSSQSSFAYWFRCRFGCSVSRWRRDHLPGALPLRAPAQIARASVGGPGRTARKTSA